MKACIKEIGKEVSALKDKFTSSYHLIEREDNVTRLEEDYIQVLIYENKEQWEKIEQKTPQQEREMIKYQLNLNKLIEDLDAS